MDIHSRLVRAVILALALLVAAPAAADSEHGGPRAVHFALSDGARMAGFVYDAARHAGSDERRRRPLLILVHGASDTHAVFDFAPGYRAARAFAERGFSVLAVDRVGYGASSRPNGDSLNFATQARQLHEVIGAVRGGALGSRPPAIVVLGVSAGADIVVVEAGTFHDVDGVIIGFHTDQLQPALFEVDIDAWLSQGPYFDFGVPFRTDFFYARPGEFAEQRIIDLDNATRSLVPRAEIVSALNAESAPFRAEIAAPILLMQADRDALFVPQNDEALFTGSPDVSFERLRRSGHKGFSHRTSRDAAVDIVRRWLDDRF